MSATRIFSGVDGAPRILAVIPLTPDVDARSVATSFGDALGLQTDDCPESGIWRLRCVNRSFVRDIR